jgi:hypothetical protein
VTKADFSEQLQLSATLQISKYAGLTVEEAIERNPLYVRELVESGQVSLAVGALRYLQDELKDWYEVEEIWDETKRSGKP